MSDRWALIVAIDQYLDPALGAVPYAEAAARAGADALAAAGCPKKNQFVLLGQHATKAAIESRARKLKRLVKKGDSVLVWIDAHGFRHKGRGVLATWDTLPDDLVDTGVAVADLVKDVGGAKAAEVVFLLDVGVGPKPSAANPAAVEPHLDFDELNALFAASANAVCLTATTGEEDSHTVPAFKASAWVHLILDAIGGRGAKAITPEGTVTALSLQQHIDVELPRVLRKHFDGRVTQTPRLFGPQNAAAVVADLSALLGTREGGGLLDPQRLKRIVFRTESSGRVKELSGFRKTFRLPDYAGPSARQFIAKCAAADLREDLDAVFETARDRLGYKRKDIDTTVAVGTGSLRTPDFEYTVTVTLDAAMPTQVIWRREVGQLSDIGFVRGGGFESAFGRTFDQLAFEFASPVDVGELVDRLEDAPPGGVKLTVESDGSACEVTLTGFTGSVRVERTALTVRGRSGDAAGLLDQFLAFIGKVGSLGEPLALPAKR